jgi:DNA-binding response OmpR family regulator
MEIKILLLEDDYKLANEIRQFLNGQSYKCDVVYDGMLFFKQWTQEQYHLYLLDLNVPVMNGLEVCKKIREKDTSTPILVLTAYSSVEDKVDALGKGADDYLVKPFHFDELNARIKALLRRSVTPHQSPEEIIHVSDLSIDLSEMKVERSGKVISLTPKEYKLLELLAKAKGRVVSKQTISEQVWGIDFETGTNTIEVYISFLRNKIDKDFDKKLIHTRTGYGYYLKEE